MRTVATVVHKLTLTILLLPRRLHVIGLEAWSWYKLLVLLLQSLLSDLHVLLLLLSTAQRGERHRHMLHCEARVRRVQRSVAVVTIVDTLQV